MDGLERFVAAQERVHDRAVAELRRGRKDSHWMWFVFPQLRGLGRSDTARFYGISGLAEARAYLAHPVLGQRLWEAAEAALAHAADRGAEEIFGPVDAMKLRSSATLFRAAGAGWMEPVLDAFFGGVGCERTLALIGAEG